MQKNRVAFDQAPPAEKVTFRFSDVIRLTPGGLAWHGQSYTGAGSAWGVTGKRIFSAWIKTSQGGSASVVVTIRNSADQVRALIYDPPPSSGSYSMDVPYNVSGGQLAYFHSTRRNDGTWRRLERNLMQDFQAAFPGETFAQVAGLTIQSNSSTELRIANVRLSNSMTVEKNVLSGGSIGQIARNRTVNPATYEHEDRFFHYDQVGSVMTVTDADGELAGRRYADAFGNTLEDWTTGFWAAPQAAAGWGHNTKQTDGGTGIVYMYQRWYLAHTGTFASQAPYPPMIEHEYGFAEGNPVMRVDPDGRYSDLYHSSLHPENRIHRPRPLPPRTPRPPNPNPPTPRNPCPAAVKFWDCVLRASAPTGTDMDESLRLVADHLFIVGTGYSVARHVVKAGTRLAGAKGGVAAETVYVGSKPWQPEEALRPSRWLAMGASIIGCRHLAEGTPAPPLSTLEATYLSPIWW